MFFPLRCILVPSQKYGHYKKQEPAAKCVGKAINLRVVLTVHDSKAIDKSIVSELSAKLRKTGCMCVLDNGRKALVRCSLPIACSNLFRSLKDDDVTIKKRDCVRVPQGGLQSRSAYYREYRLLVVMHTKNFNAYSNCMKY